jgi:hypothetical protein
MAKNILILGKRDINVSLNQGLNRIKIELEDGNEITMSLEVARKLSVDLEAKVTEVDMKFE